MRTCRQSSNRRTIPKSILGKSDEVKVPRKVYDISSEVWIDDCQVNLHIVDNSTSLLVLLQVLDPDRPDGRLLDRYHKG